MATGCAPAASPSLYSMLYFYLVLSGFVLHESVKAHEICGNNLCCIARATFTARIESLSHLRAQFGVFRVVECSVQCSWLLPL